MFIQELGRACRYPSLMTDTCYKVAKTAEGKLNYRHDGTTDNSEKEIEKKFSLHGKSFALFEKSGSIYCHADSKGELDRKVHEKLDKCEKGYELSLYAYVYPLPSISVSKKTYQAIDQAVTLLNQTGAQNPPYKCLLLEPARVDGFVGTHSKSRTLKAIAKDDTHL